jgi:8-oxo-dGTP pyrophosphatase MutT (NUDIX family)
VVFLKKGGCVLKLEEIESQLRHHKANLLETIGASKAAVALIILEGSTVAEPAVVFIKRAERPNDPWSGHIAFPGGRFESQDSGIFGTVCRETREEIGLDLASVQPIGRLDDQRGSQEGQSINLIVSCFIFGLRSTEDLIPNYEVAEIALVPLSSLLDPSAQTKVARAKGEHTFPGICMGTGESIIWGLTYRFVSQFFAILGHRLPVA